MAALLLLLAFQDADLRSILEEHRLELRRWTDAYRKADEDGREKLRETSPQKTLVARLTALAAKARGGPAAQAVLVELLRAGERIGHDTAVRDALAELARDHPAGDAVGPLLDPLQFSQDLEGLRGPLTALLEKSPHRDVRAAAQFTLAAMLLRSLDPTPEKKAEGRRLFESLRKDFAGTPHAAAAEGELFALENLQVGCTAPDFEAVDAEGVKFRLSDYRGKVVLLSFWGFW